jgi:LPXTG-site transpeptidase (sortase) family protein
MLVRASAVCYKRAMNVKKLLGLGIALAALLVIGFTVWRAVYYAPDDSTLTPPAAMVAGATSSVAAVNTPGSNTALSSAALDSLKPMRLEIPSIGVNAAVQYVSIKADGSMGTPAGFKDVAWYKLGTIPGQVGSAVIDGHVDNALALDGVFKHLGDVNVGDDVYVTRKDGTKLHFRVRDIGIYDYKKAPNKRIFTDASGRYLNLITCAGTWIRDAKSYDQRLVLYTELVP